MDYSPSLVVEIQIPELPKFKAILDAVLYMNWNPLLELGNTESQNNYLWGIKIKVLFIFL